jgi:hypothetical protein
MRNTSAFQPKGATGLNAGLVSYWRLDESSGNATDSVGGYTAANSNVTYSTGKINNCAVFNGSNSTLLSSNLNIGTSWTISFWINPSLLNNKTIISSDDGGSNRMFLLYVTATNMEVYGWTSGGTQKNVSATHGMSTGTWYHWTATWDSGGNLTLYKNASSVGTPVATTGNSRNNSYGVMFGNRPTLSEYYTGSTDEVGIWNRALSATEVTELYNSTNGIQLPSQALTTKAYYPLNGNALDFSGNQNTGTPTAITYPQGRFGQAAKFNGSSSSISLGAGSSFNNATFTYSAWINLQTAPTDNPNIISGSGTNYPCFRVNSSYQLNLLRQGVADLVSSSRTIKLNRWHHVVVTDDSSGNYAFYIDGYTAGSGSHAAQTWARTSNYLGNPSGERWNGLIDEVIIESRAWTAKEVETYYRKSMLNYKQSVWAKFLQAFTISESVSLTETITNLRARNFSVSETTTLTESITSALGKIVTIVESISLTETLTTTRTFLVNIAESVGLTEVLAQVKKKWNDTIKSSTSWTNSDKSSAPTWTENSKSSTTWTETDKS